MRKHDDLATRIERLAERSQARVTLTHDRGDDPRGGWSLNFSWERHNRQSPPNYWQEYVVGQTINEALAKAEKLVDGALVQLAAEQETMSRA